MGWILDQLGDIFLNVIFQAIWLIFIQGPLNLIAAVQGVFEYLTVGIVYDVIFNGQTNFGIENIPASFWGFCIIAGFLLLVIFGVQYMTYLFNEDLDQKTMIVKSLKGTMLAIVFVFFIPIGFYGLTFTIDFLQKAFQIAFGFQNANLADMLYKMGDPSWDGTINAGDIPTGYTAPNNMSENIPGYIAVMLLTWFMLYSLVMLCASVVQKSIELFLLFIIGPMVAAWAVSDSGARMKQWKDMVFAKGLVSLGTILSYSIMINFLMFFYSSPLEKFSFFEKTFINIVIGLGIATFALVAPQIIASFTGGEAASSAEGKNAMLSAQHGGRMLGAGMGALKFAAGGAGMAALFGKNKANGARDAMTENDGQENLDAAQRMRKSNMQNMSGIPGLIGKASRAVTSTVGGVGSAFTKRGWSNAFQKSKNYVAGVGAGVATIAGVNTVKRFMGAKNASKKAYGERIKNNLYKFQTKQNSALFNFQMHQNQFKNAKSQFNSGSMSKSDLKKVEKNYNKAQNDYLKNEARLAKTNSSLNKIDNINQKQENRKNLRFERKQERKDKNTFKEIKVTK